MKLLEASTPTPTPNQTEPDQNWALGVGGQQKVVISNQIA